MFAAKLMIVNDAFPSRRGLVGHAPRAEFEEHERRLQER
jgi:hypothetical protein